MKRMCSTFYCDKKRERVCCAGCDTPCKNRCLNAPERCGLAKESEQERRKKSKPKAIRLYREGFTCAEIAETLGFTKCTIRNWVKGVEVK